MNVSDRQPFNQIDPGTMQAAIPEIPGAGSEITPRGYFFLAVGAGITVWFITRVLDGALKRR